MFKNFLIVITVLFFAACGESTNKPILSDSLNKTTNDSKILDKGALDAIIQSFPSPVETSALIKDMEVPFSKKYLIDTQLADDYDTNFKKSLGLGVLSADLGYLNIYSKTNEIINYITVIKRIADDLKVGQFFDFQTLKRLAQNNENLDSLMFLSVNSYHQMDEHLRNNNRSNLSALVVTGVWIEGLYLLTQVTKEKYNDKIADRIGGQKDILNQLVTIIKVFKEDAQYASLGNDLDQLVDAYNGVKITYQKGAIKQKIEGGQVVIYPEEKSIVEMTKDQLNKIITVTEKIRNKIIALN